ncbi:general odorant-binding protein 99b-like [Uranotaenia lowii]|uniref:general odorant-binding protein 99b-like n=1 Tax=Uranotaenia lowii TaxID=190385 RepID=UPI0024795508|nr:general odorant-binding protein 99b-like [Uranotaenia lowii]
MDRRNGKNPLLLSLLMLVLLMPQILEAFRQESAPVRRSFHQVIRTIRTCARIDHVPENLVSQYMRWVFPDEPVTWSVVRCIGESLGLYDATGCFREGPNVDQLYLQLDVGRGLKRLSKCDFRQKMDLCGRVWRARGTFRSDCEKAYRLMYECAKEEFDHYLQTEQVVA